MLQNFVNKLHHSHFGEGIKLLRVLRVAKVLRPDARRGSLEFGMHFGNAQCNA